MRTVVTLALKDLRLLTREPMALFWIFVFPLLFAFFFGAIFGGGGGNNPMRIAVVDEDASDDSKAFVAALAKSDAVRVEPLPLAEAKAAVRKGDKVGFVVIKKGFGTATPFAGDAATPTVAVGMDPARKAEAGFLQGVLMEAAGQRFAQFFTDPKRSRASAQKALAELDNAEGLPPEQAKNLKGLLKSLDTFMEKWDPKEAQGAGPAFTPLRLETEEVAPEEVRPTSPFQVTFPSAVLWGLIGCVTGFALSLVAERTGGTWLRLRTAPLSRGQILAGKGLACYLACLGVAAVLLLIGRVAVGMRVESPLVMFVGVACAGFCFTGMMMFLSTLGKTEEAVSGVGMGVMMPLAMIGGGMIPQFVMPPWLLKLSVVSPMRWAIEAIEGPVWRGRGFGDLWLSYSVLVGVGAVCFLLGVFSLTRRET